MKLLAKFKIILYMGFRATLNFRKFKVKLFKLDKCLISNGILFHRTEPP